MNDMTLPPNGGRPTRGQTVARTLASVDVKLLQPFRLYEEQLNAPWLSVAVRGRLNPISADALADPGPARLRRRSP